MLALILIIIGLIFIGVATYTWLMPKVIANKQKTPKARSIEEAEAEIDKDPIQQPSMVRERTTRIQEQADTDTGFWETFFGRKSSEGKTKRDKQLAEQAAAQVILNTRIGEAIKSENAILDADHSLKQAPVRQARADEVETMVHEDTLATHENHHRQIQLANENNLPFETHKTVVHQTAINKIDHVKKKDDMELRAEEKDKDADREVRTKKQIAENEADVEFKRAMNTLVAISRFKHLQYDAFDEIRGRITTLLLEEHKVEMSKESLDVKIGQLGVIKDAIETYQKVFDAERNRLLETGSQATVQGLNSLADLTRSDGRGGEKSGDELRVKVAGNRLGEGSDNQ